MYYSGFHTNVVVILRRFGITRLSLVEILARLLLLGLMILGIQQIAWPGRGDNCMNARHC